MIDNCLVRHMVEIESFAHFNGTVYKAPRTTERCGLGDIHCLRQRIKQAILEFYNQVKVPIRPTFCSLDQSPSVMFSVHIILWMLQKR